MNMDIKPRRSLKNGRWDRRLKERMVALSNADNYDDAKHEWIATGNVWWNEIGNYEQLPDYVAVHPDKCLCGHDIVYHFEIHNTETDVRECVGSDHINSYLILRAIREETGLEDDYITDEMIEEWIQVRVTTLKKNAWWKMHGEQFTEMFDAVKDIDLRVNVRKSGKKYYDSTLRMYRDKTLVRKRSEGTFGTPRYQMASIVWRWNHPDNKKAQINTKGWPNKKLYNDLMMFYFTLEKANAIIKKEDDFVIARMAEIKKHDEIQENRLVAAKERRERVVATVEDMAHQPKFLEMCEYYGLEPFVPEQGKDNWEERFLNDIKHRMIKGNPLTDKQLAKLWEILDSDTREAVPATQKQKDYLIRLGFEGDIDDISKSDASEQINRIKQERWNT